MNGRELAPAKKPHQVLGPGEDLTLPTTDREEVFWKSAARRLKRPVEGAAKAACQT